jgi:hypothetical protein
VHSQIGVLFNFFDQCGIYWLGLGLWHTSVTAFDVDLRKGEMTIDLRIGRRFENLTKDIDLRIGRRFKNLTKDIDLRIGRRLRILK